MRGRFRYAVALSVAMVGFLVTTALAAVTFGAQNTTIAPAYSFNYSNSMDSTGTGGSLKLHEAYASDALAPKEGVYYDSSANGTTWSAPKLLSGTAVAERPGLAAAGSTVIVGWATQTSYNAYDPAAKRVFQVRVSGDNGATFAPAVSLSPGAGRVDYPIVGAAQTTFGTTNLYAIWTDANNGNIRFRMSSNGGSTWSTAITLGTSTADAADGEGRFGYPSIAATGKLIAATWISNNTGTVQVRGAELTSAGSAAAIGGWDATATLTGKMPLKTNGYAIASASPSDTGRVTVAWNTATAIKVSTYTVSGWNSLAGTNVYTLPAPYTGAYGIAAEPTAGGGMVVSGAFCKDTSLANDCDYEKKTARIDLLAFTSANSTAFSALQVVSSSSQAKQPINDAPSIVYDAGKTYLQYNGWTANYSNYRVFIKVGTGSL
jgi:hypothetical protein